MHDNERIRREYSKYLDACLTKKKKIDKCLSAIFIFAAIVNVPWFFICLYLFLLSFAFMGGTYAKEVWFEIPMLLLVLGVCYKRDKRFCFAVPVFAALVDGMDYVDVPAFGFSGLVRALNVVVGVLCVCAYPLLRADEKLRECDEYPDFTLRMNTDEIGEQKERIHQAQQERDEAETEYSTAAQQGFMDDLVIRAAGDDLTNHAAAAPNVMEDLIVPPPVQLKKEDIHD